MTNQIFYPIKAKMSFGFNDKKKAAIMTDLSAYSEYDTLFCF